MRGEKTLWRWACSAVIAVAFLALFVPGDALAQAIGGDTCWTIRISETEEGPASGTFMCRLHIKPIDLTTFAVQGSVTSADDNPFILTGTGAKKGGTIYLNLVGTQTHKSSWRDGSIMQIQLNATTLKGTFWSLGNSFDTSTRQFDADYASGSIAKRTCP